MSQPLRGFAGLPSFLSLPDRPTRSRPCRPRRRRARAHFSPRTCRFHTERSADPRRPARSIRSKWFHHRTSGSVALSRGMTSCTSRTSKEAYRTSPLVAGSPSDIGCCNTRGRAGWGGHHPPRRVRGTSFHRTRPLYPGTG